MLERPSKNPLADLKRYCVPEPLNDMATSRQIAESAQRVAHISDRTVLSARSGDVTVDRGTESITAIRRQVELIVGNMARIAGRSAGSILCACARGRWA